MRLIQRKLPFTKFTYELDDKNLTFCVKTISDETEFQIPLESFTGESIKYSTRSWGWGVMTIFCGCVAISAFYGAINNTIDDKEIRNFPWVVFALFASIAAYSAYCYLDRSFSAIIFKLKNGGTQLIQRDKPSKVEFNTFLELLTTGIAKAHIANPSRTANQSLE